MLFFGIARGNMLIKGSYYA